MKLNWSSLLFLVILVMLAFAAPAMAQNDDLPPTATEAAGLLLAFLGTALGVGTFTNVLVDALKKINLPFMAFLNPANLGGLLAEVVVVVISAVLAWLAQAYILPFAGYLDQVGIWPIIGAAVPFARWLYWQRKGAGPMIINFSGKTPEAVINKAEFLQEMNANLASIIRQEKKG